MQNQQHIYVSVFFNFTPDFIMLIFDRRGTKVKNGARVEFRGTVRLALAFENVSYPSQK